MSESTPERKRGWGSPIFSLVGAALLVAALIIQTMLSPVTTPRGLPIPLVSPSLWRFWIPYFFAVLAFGIAVDFVCVALWRRWAFTSILETIALVIGVAPLARLLWLARVANPKMLDSIGHPSWAVPGDRVDIVAALIVALLALWQLVSIWRPRRAALTSDNY